MTTHTHVLDNLADETDRCTTCDELICPNCGHVVDYDYDSDTYSHRDGSKCWLHHS